MFNITITHLNDTVTVNGRLVVLSFLVVNELFAILGNGFFIYAAIGRSEVKQTRTYVYMAYVSLTNLGVSLFVIPFKIISLSVRKWILGSEMCYFNGIMIVVWLPLSVYSMTALSIHKYISIARPMIRKNSYKSVVSMIFSTIIIVVIISVIVARYTGVWFDKDLGVCTVSPVKYKIVFFAPFLIILSYAIPTFVTVFCYWRTVVALRKHSVRMRSTCMQNTRGIKAQKRITRTLLFAFLLYIVSWTPFFVYGTVSAVIRHRTPEITIFKRVAYCMGFLSCAVNPWIYIWRNIHLRRTFSSIINGRKVIHKHSIASTVMSRRSFSYSPNVTIRKDSPNESNHSFLVKHKSPRMSAHNFTEQHDRMSYLRTPVASTIYGSDMLLADCETPDMRLSDYEPKENGIIDDEIEMNECGAQQLQLTVGL